jgi:flagellar basal-body rod protein FlgB|tara:strand:- start:221 stop:601 length:381 start_codon:yes stop_codon:yes gene_type:complete
MLEAIYARESYVALKKTLDAAVLKHQAISSNLANLETPHYKRIDINPDFEARLQKAVATGDVSNIFRVRPQIEVDRSAVPDALNGNTVKMEDELLHLQRNTLTHTFALQVLGRSLNKIKSAITGRV